MIFKVCTVTGKGQVTIPKEYRDLIELDEKDTVVIVPEQGKLVVYKASEFFKQQQ